MTEEMILRTRQILLSGCFDKTFWSNHGEYLSNSEVFSTQPEQDVLDYLNKQWSNGHPPTPEHMLTMIQHPIAKPIAQDADEPGIVYEAEKLLKYMNGTVQHEFEAQQKLKQVDKLLCPALTHYKPPKPDGFSACPWLGDYIEYSMKWSPRTPYAMHVAMGVWLLSAIAARRVRIDDAGTPKYTSMYMSIVADTSKYAKTTAANVMLKAFDKATAYDELNCRCIASRYIIDQSYVTPEKFIEMRSANKIERLKGFCDKGAAQQAELLARYAFIGQRSWVYSEFGTKMAEMKTQDPKLNHFNDILLRFDDHPDTYDAGTITRGEDTITRPYLSLLTVMTCQNFRESPRFGGNGKLWNNGQFSRWAFVTPLDEPTNRKPFPKEEFSVPVNVWQPLSMWNQELGIPEVAVTPGNEEDVKFNNPVLTIVPKEVPVKLSDVVRLHLWGDEELSDTNAMHWGYDGALGALNVPNDLQGNYTRLPALVLRLSALFASFAGSAQILIEHYALATYITETVFRPSLHDIYENSQQGAEEHIDRKILGNYERAMRMLERGNFTAAEIGRNLHIKSDDVKQLLEEDVTAGLIIVERSNADARRLEYVLKLK